MENQLIYPENTECILNIENLQLKIWVDKTGNLPADDHTMLPDTAPYAVHTPHQHAHAEMFCCPMGCLHINTPDRILQLNRGDIAVIPGGIAHNMLPGINRDYWAALRFQMIAVNRKGCRDLASLFRDVFDTGEIKLFQNTISLTEQIRDIFDHIYAAEDMYPYAMSLFDVLYRLSSMKPAHSEKPTAETGLQRGSSTMQRYEVLDYYINKCYMYPLTPAFLAEQLYISERQITRIVQNKYGLSFHKVLLGKRILVAEQMLEKSDIKIEEISRAVGFHSPDIFYKEFKKKHGTTPREYRITIKANI
jgi:AraC-like DNA-binding protein